MRIALITALCAVLEARALAAPTPESLYHQGQAAFNRADYATALVKWQASYKLSGANGLLFNLAQAYRLSGDCTRALATYRQFVASAPKSEERSLSIDFIREIKPMCDTKDQESKVEPIDPNPVNADNTKYPAKLKIAGLAVAGAGVVSVVIGMYFGDRARSLGAEVTRACQGGCDWRVYGSKNAEGHSAETKQYVFVGIGAAAIFGGGMYWLASREPRPAPIAIVPNGDGAVVTWGGSW